MSEFKPEQIKLLTDFRRKLHQFPLVSGEESKTIDKIIEYLSGRVDTKMTRIVDGKGLICEFDSGHEGPSILVRADVDALPIQESSKKSYQSIHKGKAHSCGHDGHTTILCGVAERLHENPILKGKVILLFQPSEEIGEGSQMVLDDSYFAELKIDQVIALHNIPGVELGHVLWKSGVMCAASTGVIVSIKGETGHAAYPELGNSPIETVNQLISVFNELPKQINGPGFGLRVTIAGINAGGPNFGVSPSDALLWLTLRTLDQKVLDEACNKVESVVTDICEKAGQQYKIEFTEYFEVTKNDESLITDFKEVISAMNLPNEELTEPFNWSEDFGRFTSKYPGFLFGLGSGLDCKPLHHSAYDFPDDLIPHGIRIFENYLRTQLQ